MSKQMSKGDAQRIQSAQVSPFFLVTASRRVGVGADPYRRLVARRRGAGASLRGLSLRGIGMRMRILLVRAGKVVRGVRGVRGVRREVVVVKGSDPVFSVADAVG